MRISCKAVHTCVTQLHTTVRFEVGPVKWGTAGCRVFSIDPVEGFRPPVLTGHKDTPLAVFWAGAAAPLPALAPHFHIHVPSHGTVLYWAVRDGGRRPGLSVRQHVCGTLRSGRHVPTGAVTLGVRRRACGERGDAGGAHAACAVHPGEGRSYA